MIKKRLFKIGLSVFVLTSMMFSMVQINVKAAVFGVSATNNGNGTTTVTVFGSCVGGFTISAGGASASVGKTTLDASASVTLSTGAGTFTVTATAISVSDASYNLVDGSVSTSVTVTNGSSGGSSSGGSNSGGSTSGGSSNTGNNGQEAETVANLLLNDLSVSDATLSPVFSANTLEYSVNMPRGTKKVTVNASVAGTGINVTGTGDHEVKAGDNKIEVVLNEMDGAGSKTYTINVYVEADPTVYLTGAGKKKLGIMSLNSAPILDGFEDYTFKVSGKEVTGRKNTNTGLVLLYMIDSDDNSNYYIYDEKSKKITSIYIPVALFGANYAIITVPEDMQNMTGLTYKKVKISEQEFDGWIFKDKTFKNYSLIYLMNDKAEMHLYQYESTTNTLQLYSGAAAATQEVYDQMANDLDRTKIISYCLIGSTLIFAGLSAGLGIFLLRKKRLK